MSNLDSIKKIEQSEKSNKEETTEAKKTNKEQEKLLKLRSDRNLKEDFSKKLFYFLCVFGFLYYYI
ncbi:MAG: hypothetical protein GDA46_02575 [Bdellovibrionales bacterium]|nr:hypothetical protein [Bdellovibrionales bacterium]